MTHLWTHDAFDCLCIRLSFSHWLSLLFPLVLTVPSILSSLTVREYCPHGCKDQVEVIPPQYTTHQRRPAHSGCEDHCACQRTHRRDDDVPARGTVTERERYCAAKTSNPLHKESPEGDLTKHREWFTRKQVCLCGFFTHT